MTHISQSSSCSLGHGRGTVWLVTLQRGSEVPSLADCPARAGFEVSCQGKDQPHDRLQVSFHNIWGTEETERPALRGREGAEDSFTKYALARDAGERGSQTLCPHRAVFHRDTEDVKAMTMKYSNVS